MKKQTLILLSLTALASCAGPESFQEKMNRYNPQPLMGRNQVPEFDSQGFQFSSKSGRTPASVKGTSVETPVSEEMAVSNKKLYFLSLFGQYETMKSYAQEFEAPSVNICPHFHTSLLEHKNKKTGGSMASIFHKNNKKFVYDSKRFGDAEYVATKPELSLPLAKDSVTPKVIDIFRSEGANLTEAKMDEYVHKALDIHLSKTYSEIRELCEYGVSDNYYVYENLITHIKNSEFKAADKNMNTLLKTTIFSNMALVTSLEKVQVTPMRSIASVEGKPATTPYANEVMSRLSVEWAKEYYDHLKTSK